MSLRSCGLLTSAPKTPLSSLVGIRRCMRVVGLPRDDTGSEAALRSALRSSACRTRLSRPTGCQDLGPSAPRTNTPGCSETFFWRAGPTPSANPVQSARKFLFHIFRNRGCLCLSRLVARGVRVVTDVRWGAMDGSAATDECGRRGRRSRVVLIPRRWYQVGAGADASRR